LHRVPESSIGKKLRSLRGELFCFGRISAQRQRQRRTPQAAHGLAVSRQRVGTRISFLEVRRDVPESRAQRRLRGSFVQFAGLATPAKNVQMGRLQAKAEVLLRLACVPLNFPGDGSLIALDVGHFEEALVDPRAVDTLHAHSLRDLPGLV
jgi:hypothetical protein